MIAHGSLTADRPSPPRICLPAPEPRCPLLRARTGPPARSPRAGRGRCARSSAERPSSRQRASKIRRASAEISAAAIGEGDTGRRGVADRGKQLREDVLGAAAQDRPVAQQLVRSRRGLRKDGARHGEDVAAEVVGQPRRNERARAARGLDDDDARREPRDDPVAHRKILGPRLRARRVLRDEEVLGAEPPPSVAVLARIVHVQAAAQDRDRPARALERRLVRRGVHAARETRDDRHPGARELPREPPGDVPAVPRRRPAIRRPRPPEAAAARGARARRGETAGPRSRRGPADTPRRKPSRDARRRARSRPPTERPPVLGRRAARRGPAPATRAPPARSASVEASRRFERPARAQDRPQPLGRSARVRAPRKARRAAEPIPELTALTYSS